MDRAGVAVLQMQRAASIQLDAGFALRRVEEIAPVIERLAG